MRVVTHVLPLLLFFEGSLKEHVKTLKEHVETLREDVETTGVLSFYRAAAGYNWNPKCLTNSGGLLRMVRKVDAWCQRPS